MLSGRTAVRNTNVRAVTRPGPNAGIASTAGRVGGVSTPTPTTTPAPVPSDDTTDARRRRTTVGRTTAAADADHRDDRDDRDGPRALRGEDRAFVQNVLSDHLMHVRLARRAKRETNDRDTRRLAESIEKDFGSWAERWERFADRRDAEVNSRLERHNREKLERLDKAADRKQFDRAYAEIVADHLESMVDDFRDEADEDRPGAVRRLIQEELPMLREHLASARRLERQENDKK